MRKKVINIHSLVEKIEIKTCCGGCGKCSSEHRADLQDRMKEEVVEALFRVINNHSIL
jgi:acyl-ACP thioesterase